MGSLFLELSKQRSLLKMMEERGFTLCQQNGQRTYGGPPPNWGLRPPPSRDCEVFIGRLPRMCFEDELIPLFLTAGELYEFRLMLDFSGTNRGYGYAHYATPDGAQRAIEKLNKYEIRPGHQIGVLRSKNNCRLLFGNIGSALDVGSFNEFIRTTTDQVLNVVMFKNFQQLMQTDFRISSEVEEAFLGRMPRNNGNNQFAIVEYENHKAAAVARRVLIPKYGHILAIDWAVPPRERKRFCMGSESPAPALQRALPSTTPKSTDSPGLSKSNSKIRPVPLLLIQPSPLDNVPHNLKTVVKFFKYQLSVCLYKSVDQMEIPLFICKEIEKKIVDRITNLENCSQAVQLIFNYFSWYNEKKRFIINTEIQNLLQEVKNYADLFVFFVTERLNQRKTINSIEDSYYMNILPLQLNILFRIFLRSAPKIRAESSLGISKGLKWLTEIVQSGNEPAKEFINDIITLVNNEDGTSLDKASALSKSLFLSNINLHQLPQNLADGVLMDFSLPKVDTCESVSGSGEDFGSLLNENQMSVSSTAVTTFQKVSSNLKSQHLKDDTGHYIPVSYSQISSFIETNMSAEFNPPVPLLIVQPSIMNKVPFMPDIFNNVLTYFKHLIKGYLSVSAWQMNIPFYVLNEIEKKIIDRISNMENCSEAIQLILNYFSLWVQKNFNQTPAYFEIQTLLEEIKMYADSFFDFVRKKTMSVYVPNEAAEYCFCNMLPLWLNILFNMMLIFNSENPARPLNGITKGLIWLENFIQNSDKTARQFLNDLIQYILKSDLMAYERAKKQGKIFCSEMMNFSGQTVVSHQVLPSFMIIGYPGTRFSDLPLSRRTSSDYCTSVTVNDSASDMTVNYNF